MDNPKVVSRDEWLAARTELLVREKELTRQGDALAADRRRLPMVAVDKEYVFEGPNGRVDLLGLFEGRGQLVIYHFMFGPDWEEGCPSCSFLADHIPHLGHLHRRDTSFAAVSRAPWSRIEPFKARMGWTFPWYSSFGSDFNYDFHVTQDEAVAPVEYNFRDKAELERAGQSWHTAGEQPGISVFFRDGDRILHSYSSYARGGEILLGTYQMLDLTPLGRQEGNGEYISTFLHHDRYPA